MIPTDPKIRRATKTKPLYLLNQFPVSFDRKIAASICVHNDVYKILSVTKPYHKILQDNLSVGIFKDTVKNIEEGQREFSQGVMQAARNPISHVTNRLMEDSGLFTEQDCLDLLFLISHLYRRVENSVLVIND